MKKLAFLAAFAAFAASSYAQPFAAWSRYREITLNTTATGGGANVANPVTNFPLLVRLTNASASTGANVLNEALSTGADIRFTDSTGATALSYQIEEWSATSGAVWVKIPTVAASGNTKIRMYWGKSDAVSASSPASVFDTAAGFTGAWHLDENGGGTGNILDATANALNFNGHDSVLAVPGMIGKARYYNRSEDNTAFWIDNFTGTANAAKEPKFYAKGTSTLLTISTWVNPQANSGQDIQGIFGQYRYNSSNRSYMLSMSGTSPGAVRINTSADGGNDRVVESTTQPLATLNAWYHVMLTIDQTTPNSQIKVYVNGAAVPMANHATQGIYAVSSTSDNSRPFIGAMETSYNHRFIGYIDELQFSNGIARSPAWAKLSYETQKPAPTAVILGAALPSAPRTLFYPFKNATYKRAALIENNAPVVTGGTATSYSYTGTLPTGLNFSTSTGIISGTPSVITSQTELIVTVNLSGGGTGKDTLTITVIPGDPPGAPAAPTAVLGSLGSGQATVTWTVPSVTGSSAITGYKAVAVQDTTKSCTTTTALTCTISTLGSIPYSFKVRAINSEGAGAFSPESNLLTPPTVPGASPAISGVAGPSGSGTVTVYWNAAPAGGSPITGYKVMAVSDTTKACTWTTGDLLCVVSGLTIGQSYSFVVKATNAVGTGPASSASSSVIIPGTVGGITPFVLRVSGAAKPFTYTLPQEALATTDKLTMSISDVWGRTVWSRSVNPMKEGRELTWNGKASNGRPVSAGMYIVRISALNGGKTIEYVQKEIAVKPL